MGLMRLHPVELIKRNQAFANSTSLIGYIDEIEFVKGKMIARLLLILKDNQKSLLINQGILPELF